MRLVPCWGPDVVPITLLKVGHGIFLGDSPIPSVVYGITSSPQQNETAKWEILHHRYEGQNHEVLIYKDFQLINKR